MAVVCITAQAFAADWPVRELARKIAAAAGHEVSIEVSGPDAAVIRTLLARELRISANAPAAVTVASGESWRAFVLAAEVRRGEERRYAVATTPRMQTAPPASGLALEKMLLRTQAERMLDAVEAPGGLYVLEPSRITGPDGERNVILPPSRDPRARLVMASGGPTIEPAG